MNAFVSRHSLLLYFGLTFTAFWTGIALGLIHRRFGFWAPVLGALAPGVVGLLLSGITEGEPGIRALVRRLGVGRVGLHWYPIVLGLPVAQALLAIGVATLSGCFSAARFGDLPLSSLLPGMWVAFVFAACEELGWRGYALPRLLDGRSAVSASLILGALHAAWHWPLVVPPRQWLGDALWLTHLLRLVRGSTFIVAEAILLTWIFRNTGGSVLMTSLYHGMSNVAMLLYQGIDQARIPWLRPSISVLTALAVVFASGRDLMRKLVRQDVGQVNIQS